MRWNSRPQHFPDMPSADRFTDTFYSLWALNMNCGIESPFSRKWLNWPVSEADHIHRSNRRTTMRSDAEYRRMWRFRGGANSAAVR